MGLEPIGKAEYVSDRTASSPVQLSGNLSANTLLLFNLKKRILTPPADWLIFNFLVSLAVPQSVGPQKPI